ELALIIARAVEGVGAALTRPLIVAHATAVVPDDRRGWAIGVVASAGTSFLVIGPLLGGLLVDTVGWRWMFLINVPLAIFAIALGARYMRESRAPNPAPLDLAGLALLTAALALIVAALLHMQTWDAWVDLGALASGAGALMAFVAVERRSDHPLLSLTLLRKPRVIVSLTSLIAI